MTGIIPQVGQQYLHHYTGDRVTVIAVGLSLGEDDVIHWVQYRVCGGGGTTTAWRTAGSFARDFELAP